MFLQLGIRELRELPGKGSQRTASDLDSLLRDAEEFSEFSGPEAFLDLPRKSASGIRKPAANQLASHSTRPLPSRFTDSGFLPNWEWSM